ncbi:UBE2C [Cordylochernes scorpioides]|uniref:UBE2C n=1 Tax=Cordylochernes scorpioides TaxID=51811 RepID=A0ABY6LBZ8_9ARAC|nr:UBE2C [Cordylochernes scorpioides]
MSGDKGISGFPDGDNFFKWVGTIEGPAGTVNLSSVTRGKDVTDLCVPPGVRRPQLQADLGVPQHLPLSGPYGPLHHPLLPPQCGQEWQHLPGHPQGAMVGSLRCQHYPALYTVSPGWLVSSILWWHLLLSIQSLLGEPNIESPLNVQAAELWTNQALYRKVVHEQYDQDVRKKKS